jgi:hypothetical protein
VSLEKTLEGGSLPSALLRMCQKIADKDTPVTGGSARPWRAAFSVAQMRFCHVAGV